jgi:NADPH:quinone reductase-like Zn-dependent oxidoreductase
MKLRRIIGWSAAAITTLVLLAVLIAYARSTNECYDGSAGPPRIPMKAVVYCEYGGPDVLNVVQVEKPVPDSGEVLVRVRAAAVNPLDWHMMRGTPYIGRLGMGLRRPAVIRFGVDFAGMVEAIGPGVTQFAEGDEVFGGRTGALAEYVTVHEDAGIALKPAALTFEQAAALPVAGVAALQGVRDEGRVRAGQKVLINGASGGVGTLAVQIAKAEGAQVTGVCSTRNVDLVRSLGADHVVDYTRKDFTASTGQYDVIIDNVGNHSLQAIRGVLKPEGSYVMVGGPKGRWLDPLPRAFGVLVMSKFVTQDMGMFLADMSQKNLNALRELVEAGKLRPVIDRTYPLNDVRSAIAYLETGRARGKVVVTID